MDNATTLDAIHARIAEKTEELRNYGTGAHHSVNRLAERAHYLYGMIDAWATVYGCGDDCPVRDNLSGAVTTAYAAALRSLNARD